MCGILCERSGVVNIGIEGMMLTGAFVGFAVGSWSSRRFCPTARGTRLRHHPAAGRRRRWRRSCARMVLAAVHAWLSISVRADQIISGTIINIAAIGLTGYLNLAGRQRPRRRRAVRQVQASRVRSSTCPSSAGSSRCSSTRGPSPCRSSCIVIILQIMLFRSRWGLRTRAVGEHPKAADTVGVDVIGCATGTSSSAARWRAWRAAT